MLGLFLDLEMAQGYTLQNEENPNVPLFSQNSVTELS